VVTALHALPYELNRQFAELPASSDSSAAKAPASADDATPVPPTLALACNSFEMGQISFRISLEKGRNFVINFVLYKKNSHISHSPQRISRNFTHFAKYRKILRHLLLLASNPLI
jgi:hypothetical protein